MRSCTSDSDSTHRTIHHQHQCPMRSYTSDSSRTHKTIHTTSHASVSMTILHRSCTIQQQDWGSIL